MKGWHPAETAPYDTPVRTKLKGEAGENVCAKMRRIYGDDGEAIDVWLEVKPPYRDTVVHGSFAAPSHWKEIK